jgi:iron complex transport system substrate-binding protein
MYLDSRTRTGSMAAAVAAILLQASIAGCGGTGDRSSERSADVADSVVLRDAVGEILRMAGPPRRIVSLAPNLTEMIFTVGAGDRLIGRTSFCTHPPAAASAAVVGDLMSVDYEKVVALHPDLVIMSYAGNSLAVYRKLKELGLNVFVLGAESIDGVIGSVDTVGMLTGRSSQAGAASARLRRTVDSIRALVATSAPVPTFVVIDKTPLMTVSRGFLAEMVAAAGGRNIAEGAAASYPHFNREELLRVDPEVILIPAYSREYVREVIAAYPEWSRLRAAREEHIYGLPADVVLRPGPRLGESIVLLYQSLHGGPAIDSLRPDLSLTR